MGIRPGGQLWTAWTKRREGGLWTCLRWGIGKIGITEGSGGEDPRVPDGLAWGLLSLEGVEMDPMPQLQAVGR